MTTPHDALRDEARRLVPRPASPGRELAALMEFHVDADWTGTIEENGMGPGSPRMRANGSGRHRTIQNGLWIVGEYQQDQYLEDGTFVLKWELLWVAGWDASTKEYRATYEDNFGNAGVMRGWIAGDRLTFESASDSPVKIRLIWDAANRSDVVWTNEVSVANGPWSLVETYHLRPVT